ncbi:cell wall-binding repeat-containing protein [Candidatus Poriferisodalis sp.]|uniref:cell wall-binding repeat-containing protein n=1 Tax=Candidatus Poriferisodalis sp. TaxID=3101277 RepID=UPI003B58F67C
MSPARGWPQRRLRGLTIATVSVALAGSVLFAPQPAAAQALSVSVQRVSGSNVYELAARVAGGSCEADAGSHSVAIASGENWPDALAGAALDRPLLLTTQAFLPAVTRDYLEPCAANAYAKVIILGGPAAVSENVAETLRSMGYQVVRVAGDDRYDTARRAARAFAPASLSTVYLASGANFADAVAVAPSVTGATPLILTPPGELGDQARRFLTDEGRPVASVTILGGHAAVSARVEAEIKDLGIVTDRIAGADRYETAALIARRALGMPSCHPVTDVAVASGTDPFGGLAAGAVRSPCQPLLLAPGPDSPVPEALAGFGRDWRLAIGDSTPTTVTGIGSSSVIPAAALATVAAGLVRGSGGSGGSDATGTSGWGSVAPSVVQVRCVSAAGATRKRGSGFIVGDGYQIVTNQHVVFEDDGRECRRLRAYLGGTFEQAAERYVPLALVRATEERDLALLRMDPGSDPLPALTIATEPLQAGETLTAIGYPSIGGDTLTLTTGRYSGTTEQDGLTWIKTDTPISPGSSGGPVLNERREVIGVATLLRLAIRGSGGTTVGSLGLLVPAEDVLALLAGDIGQ